jgi:hypothetical protein
MFRWRHSTNFFCAVFFCGGFRRLWSTGEKLEAGLLVFLFLVPLVFRSISFGRLSNKVMNNNDSV